MGEDKRRRSTASDPPPSARKAAAALLAGVLGHKRQISDLIDPDQGPLSGLGPSDRARAQRLATGALRYLGSIDTTLKPFLRKRPPDNVHAVLRLAVFEMCAESAPAHGVVNSSVAVVRGLPKGQQFAGLANAVLRRVADEGIDGWAALPPQRLPGWLRGRLLSQYGAAKVAAIEKVHAVAPPLDLSAKPGTGDALAQETGGDMLPGGSVRLHAPGQVSRLPGYAEGTWWVQDAAAAVPVRVLAPQSEERVLDLCAAPGGKTLQLAAAGAQVTALDSSAVRMTRLTENLERTGLAAACVTDDVLTWDSEPFDAVLLDAPCSATGTIRRHPDLPFLRTVDELKSLVKLQAALLDRAISLTKPGGRLVYCTCSLLAEEGEAQIEAALSRHTDLSRLPIGASDLDAEWILKTGDLRITPDSWAERGGIDGFYIAALTRAHNL